MPRRPGDVKECVSAFDQSHFAGARSFAGFFRGEFNALAFAKQLEHRAAHRAAMKEVFDSSFVADESEPLVDQKASDRPGRHTRVLRKRTPEIISWALPKLVTENEGRRRRPASARGCAEDLPKSCHAAAEGRTLRLRAWTV